MSESSKNVIDLVSSDDEEVESCENASEQDLQQEGHNYICIPCINKSLICPNDSRDLNCPSCSTLSKRKGDNLYWCYICNSLTSCACHSDNHDIESYNDFYQAHSILIKSNIKQTNLACDEAVEDYQQTQSAIKTIIAWLKVIQSGITQRASSSTDASFLCQVFIAKLESLKTTGVFHVAEKEDSGILNFINHLTTHFTDRLTQVQAAQAKVRNFLEKCSFHKESSESSHLVEKITEDLTSSNKSCVDILISMLNGKRHRESAPDLHLSNRKTDNMRNPKRLADEKLESDTVKIRKNSQGLQSLGYQILGSRTTDTDNVQHSQPFPAILIKEQPIISVDNYFTKFNEMRSDLSQTFQEAQVKLKIFEEETIVFANEAANLPKRLADLEVELALMAEKVKLAEKSEAKARQEASSLLKHAKVIQGKYEKELVQHTFDVGQLNALREEYDQLEQRHSQIEYKLASLQKESLHYDSDFISERTCWKTQKEVLEKECLEKDQRCAKRKKIIEALQAQVTSLNSRIAATPLCQEVVLRALRGEDADLPLDSCCSESDVRSLNQSLKMVRCLLHEKNIAVSRCEVLDTELQSIKTQFEETKKNQSAELQVILSKEREEKQVLIDSYRFLKEEKDGLAVQVEELAVKNRSLTSELGSLRNINQQWSGELEEATEENKTLRNEISTFETETVILEEKLKQETKILTETKQTNIYLEQEVALAQEMSKKSQSELVETLAKLEEKTTMASNQEVKLQQIVLDHKVQYEKLKIKHDKLVEKNNEMCAVQTKKNKEYDESMVILQEKLKQETKMFTEMQQTNIYLEQEVALAQEMSKKSQSELVEALAKLEEKTTMASNQEVKLQQIVLDHKAQYEKLKIKYEKFVEEHEEICAIHAKQNEEWEASMFKINTEIEELMKTNTNQEKLKRKVRDFVEKRNLGNLKISSIPQVVPVIGSSPTLSSATFFNVLVDKNQDQLQLLSSEMENSSMESRPDIIPLCSIESSDPEGVNVEATVNQQALNFSHREYEIFVHDKHCRREENGANGMCTIRLCHPLKIVLKHSTSCHTGELCQVPDCWFSLAYQSEEVSNEITRLESDLQLTMEHAELAEESEAAALREVSNQVERAKEDREKYENELGQCTAEIKRLNILLEQSRSQLALTKLAVQLIESQKINTQLIAEKQEWASKFDVAKEEIKDLQTQKESILMKLEQLKQSHTSLMKQLADSQQNNTQLTATNQELEEGYRIAKEEIMKIESHKELLKKQIEEATQSQSKLIVQVTESQQKNMKLIATNQELEERARVANEELQKLLSEVTHLREIAVKYVKLKNYYSMRKIERENVFKEKKELQQCVDHLRSELELAKKESEGTLRKTPRLEAIQENQILQKTYQQDQQTTHQKDQQKISVKNAVTPSILRSCNEVLNKNQPKLVNPTLPVAPSAAVVPSAESSSSGKDVCVIAEDNEKSRKLFITRQHILNHARKCHLRKCDSKAKCRVPLCLESFEVVKHLRKCQSGASCQTPHCLSSQKKILYWKSCNQAGCPLCNNTSVNQNKASSGVARSETTTTAARSETLCDPLPKVNGGQFCSTKRFEFLAMAMLTSLHNRGVYQFLYPCNNCKSMVETRYRCNLCSSSNFSLELCIPCYNKDGHCHLVDEIGFRLDSNQSAQSFVHSLNCNDANCKFLFCRRMKMVVKHMTSCEISGCYNCYQLVSLIIYHAASPQTKCSKDCAVPFCQFLKRRIASSANMTIKSAFSRVESAARNSGYENWNNSVIIEDPGSYSMAVLPRNQQQINSTIGSRSTAKIVNPELILPSELCKYSEYGIY